MQPCACSPMLHTSRTGTSLRRRTGVAIAVPRLRWGSTLAVLCIVLWLGCRSDAPGDPEQEPPPGPATTAAELGRRLAPFDLELGDLSPAAQDQILRGSYLVNGLGVCDACHASPAGEYLAGGAEFPTPFPDVQGFTAVVARNLTPDPETGLLLTEDEFREVMRTGLDIHDSTDNNVQRLLIMPWHVYRFMSQADLQAIYAYLRRVPPVHNAMRKTFILPAPFPPVPFPGPAEVAPGADPDNSERGLLIPQFFSSGPAAAAFVAQWTAHIVALTATQRAEVGRGSYLVNALLDCQSCHTDGDGDGNFDSGLRPGTVDVNTAAYLAGGVNLGPFFGMAQLFSRNLTPEPTTGLGLSAEQFAQALELGVDFRRPGHSLRTVPHFPTEYFVTPADLQAVYAFLRSIPAVVHAVEIVP